VPPRLGHTVIGIDVDELDFGLIRERMRQPVVIDGRNLLDPAAMRVLGFVYRGIGRARAADAPHRSSPLALAA
jgi:UDPglucose 6-dehydrogenase